MLHINNLFFYDNVVIDREFNGRVDGDQEGRRLAGELSKCLHMSNSSVDACGCMAQLSRLATLLSSPPMAMNP